MQQVRLDGQIIFSHGRPSDLHGMNECLQKAAADQQGVAPSAVTQGLGQPATRQSALRSLLDAAGKPAAAPST